MSEGATDPREDALAPPLGDLYRSLAGSRVYFDELPGGNNGDQLIILGSRHFRSAFGFDSVTRPEDAEVIIVRGNGVLTDFYARTPHRARMQAYIDHFPGTTFVLEPSTISFGTEPAFRVGERNGPVYLYARDRTSYEDERRKTDYLDRNVAFGLDHDMAFRLAGSTLVDDLLGARSPRHALIVERYDIERPERGLRRRPARVALSRAVPAAVKNVLRPHLARARATLDRGFRQEAEGILAAGPWADMPLVAGDLSNPRIHSFDDFLDLVRDSGAVVTQRLHVGVLSALLGIETWLDDRGYYKIRGIWEQSMRSMPHVHLLSGTDSEVGT